jgi:hypothetical protein
MLSRVSKFRIRLLAWYASSFITWKVISRWNPHLIGVLVKFYNLSVVSLSALHDYSAAPTWLRALQKHIRPPLLCSNCSPNIRICDVEYEAFATWIVLLLGFLENGVFKFIHLCFWEHMVLIQLKGQPAACSSRLHRVWGRVRVSDHFGSDVGNLSLHFCKRLFLGLFFLENAGELHFIILRRKIGIRTRYNTTQSDNTLDNHRTCDKWGQPHNEKHNLTTLST